MKLRVFVTTSPFTTALMADYAARTAQAGQRDYLLMDAIRMSESYIDTIRQASSLHTFEAIHDFSQPIGEGESRKPNMRKQLTRKLKTLPVFKQVYGFFFQFKLKKEEKAFNKRLLAYIPALETDEVEIHTQPNLHLNKALFPSFPEVPITYYEHGLGDYLDLKKKRNRAGVFRCVFAEGFKTFLAAQHIDVDVEPVLSPTGLGTIDFDVLKTAREEIPSGKKLVIILLQPLEQQKVDLEFWPTFLQLVIERMKRTEDVLYLLKPHPFQGPESKEIIESSLQGQDHLWLDSPHFASLNVEFLYPALAPDIAGVFSPFSSAIFYLSYLYPSPEVIFGYALETVFSYTAQTPQLYIKRWRDLDPYLVDVFGKRAERLD